MATRRRSAFQHLALVVADMAHGLSARARCGCDLEGRPTASPRLIGGVHAYKFRDPDGHPLELLRFPDSSPPAAWQGKSAAAGQIGLGIDHSAISVADADASAAFYGSLGLDPRRTDAQSGSEAAAPRQSSRRGGHGGADAARRGDTASRAAGLPRSARRDGTGAAGRTTSPRRGSSGGARGRRCCATPTVIFSKSTRRDRSDAAMTPITLLPGRLLRRAGAPKPVAEFPGRADRRSPSGRRARRPTRRIARPLRRHAARRGAGVGAGTQPAAVVGRAEPPAARLASGRHGDGRHRRHLFHERQRARAGRPPRALRARAALHQPLTRAMAIPNRSSPISKASGSIHPTTWRSPATARSGSPTPLSGC